MNELGLGTVQLLLELAEAEVLGTEGGGQKCESFVVSNRPVGASSWWTEEGVWLECTRTSCGSVEGPVVKAHFEA